MLDSDTKRKINNLRNILVGKVPDPKSQVDQITLALIYKFMYDIDKKSMSISKGKPKFFKGELKEYSWERIVSPKTSGQERVRLYDKALDKFAKAKNFPSFFKDIFKNATLPYKDEETLRLFVHEINQFNYNNNGNGSDCNSEGIGNAFEYLLSILGSQGDAGQFRTPRHIIDFIVEVVNPKKNESILDPACGTAGFLISAFKSIKRKNSKNYKEKEYINSFERADNSKMIDVESQKNGQYKGDLLNSTEWKSLFENIVGYDISPDMVKLSSVNLFLHQFTAPKISIYDTLSSDSKWGEKYDVILANPPFMTPRGGIRPHNKISINANRSEVLFVSYIMDHLKRNGRAGIVVPEGIIFKSDNSYKELRKSLLFKYLWAVVSLPAGVFKPYSGVKTSILFLDRKKYKETDEVLFVNIKNDGFDLGANRKKINKNDLPQAFEDLKNWSKGKFKEKNSSISFLVKKNDIKENETCNLSLNCYKLEEEILSNWSLVELGEVAEVSSGNSTPQEINLFKDGIYPFCKTSDVGKIHVSSNFKEIKNHLNEKGIKGLKLFKKNTILFPKNGASIFLNHRVILAVDSYVSSTLATIYSDDKKILPKFLFNLLCFVDAKKLTNKIYYPSLKLSEIKQIKIPLPPLKVQKEIVDEIDSYQKIIDGANQIVETWKSNFKIDPSWSMVKLGEICDIISGQSPESKYYNKKGEGLPFYQGKTEFSDIYLGKPVMWTNKTTKIAQKNDILISVRAPVGPVNISTEKICIGRGLAVIRAKDKVNMKFLFYFLKSISNQIRGSGSVFDSINQKQVKQIKIPLPPLKAQKEIVEQIEKEERHVESCKELIKINTKKIQKKINEVWKK